jgi:AcrR family transcriptional regulator
MLQPVERSDARANRLRLIAAAHQVFREQGIEAEMKTIAERAGVGVGTIYRNFPTKDDLITAIVTEAIERISETIATAIATEDPVAGLRTFIEGGCATAEQYGDVLMAVMSGSMPPAAREAFEHKDEIGDIGQVLERGKRLGVFRADLDSAIAAANLIACFIPWHFKQLRLTHTPEQIVEAHLRFVLHGALAEHAPTSTER